MMRGKREAAIVAATTLDPVQRLEIVADRRRRHDASLRAQVVADCLDRDARVQDVARRHGICPSLVYRWRRMAGSGPLAPETGFLPVRISEDRERPPPAGVVAPRAAGMIEIELSGGTRVRVDETVSLSALRRVLSALRG